ncbi:MAG TPA: hypothetical protein VHG53_01935 [Candidatus Limnocylindria bacterium]|nr:hypothetical protein [Candidatus Limnocylindria bacterium]
MTEKKRYESGDRTAAHYADLVHDHDAAVGRRTGGATERFRADELPWEESPHGRLKHLANADMGGALASMDAFILELPPGGRSGRHRHFAEELVYVIEGRGHDRHWDPEPAIGEHGYVWPMPREEAATRWDWAAGDSIFVPPMVAHEHINDDPEQPVRLLCSMSRIYDSLGFGGIEQLEPAPGR